MGQGIFSGRFYVLQEPINVQSVNIRLNVVQNGLINNILYMEWMQCLRHELGGIAHGIIYHKDHYKPIPNATVHHYQPLIQHSNIFYYFIYKCCFKKKAFIIIYYQNKFNFKM